MTFVLDILAYHEWYNHPENDPYSGSYEGIFPLFDAVTPTESPATLTNRVATDVDMKLAFVHLDELGEVRIAAETIVFNVLLLFQTVSLGDSYSAQIKRKWCTKHNCSAPIDRKSCAKHNCSAPIKRKWCAKHNCPAPIDRKSCAKHNCSAPIMRNWCTKHKCSAPMDRKSCAKHNCSAPIMRNWCAQTQPFCSTSINLELVCATQPFRVNHTNIFWLVLMCPTQVLLSMNQ
jgi:hypothetical protein